MLIDSGISRLVGWMCSVLSMRGAIFFVSSVCVPFDEHKHVTVQNSTQSAVADGKKIYYQMWDMQKMVQCHIAEAH